MKITDLETGYIIRLNSTICICGSTITGEFKLLETDSNVFTFQNIDDSTTDRTIFQLTFSELLKNFAP